MPIDPTKPEDGVPADKADLRANLQAAQDGVQGAGQIFTTGSPFTIDDTDFGDSWDYFFVWNASGDANVTLATGVPFGKGFHALRLGAGEINIAATNVVTGAVSTASQYDSIVLRSLGNNTWARVQS